MKQGKMRYNEYSCPCGGRTTRRKVSTRNAWWTSKVIFTYYYECDMCGKESEQYEADISNSCT